MKIPYINLKEKLDDVIESEGVKEKSISSSKLAGSTLANVGIAIFNNREEILKETKNLANKIIEEGKKAKEKRESEEFKND